MSVSEDTNYAQNRARIAELDAQTEQIRILNDRLRQGRDGGMVVVTPGIRALPSEHLAEALQGVQIFDAFSTDDDPHGEHDFGAIDIAGQRIFWKVDCYDKTLEFGSPNPTDPDVTTRVLTVMLAEEY